MTIKEALLGKLEELKKIESTLLEMSMFLDPDNNIFVYHSLGISKIEGTVGSTPNNLSEILDVVADEVMKYVDYISKIPNKESSIVLRERGVLKYSILSTDGMIPAPITWNEISTGASFESVQQFLPMSSYRGFVRKIRIHTFPSFRKGGFDGADIDFTTVLYRLNVRKNILEEYMSGNGIMDVTLDNEHLYGDDIFIIGLKQDQKIITTSVYYSNLSYDVEITGEDDSYSSNVYTIGKTRVGNIVPNVDNSIDGGILYWSMFTLNDFTVRVTDEFENKETTLLPNPYANDIPTYYSGNTIKEIVVDGIRMDISALKISFRGGISEKGNLIDDTYRLYDTMDNGISTIVFKNVKPIDVVLEEAINAL
jgi:hypothetical protein